MSGADLDDVLEAMADFVDLRSNSSRTSRGIADLGAEAARLSGLATAECTTIRRAVPSTTWEGSGCQLDLDKPGPLTDVERERAHLHPYLTDKMLMRIPALAPSRKIAARHHERLDGSGDPRGLTAASLTPPDRTLAAADVYHAMTEARPHRPALDADHAAQAIRGEVRAGRLDGDAVNAVLRAFGHRAQRDARARPG